MDPTAVINLAVAALGLAMLAAAIFVAFKGSYNKARIEALREDNNDLRARVGDLQTEVADGKRKEELLDGRVRHVEQENALLKEMVLQRADVGAVGEKLERHHQEAMAAWAKMSAALERMSSDGAA